MGIKATTNRAYTVAVIPPDAASMTPSASLGEVKFIYVNATSAPRAQSKAMKEAAEHGWNRKDYIILETYIDRDEEKRVPAWSWDEEDED